MKIILLTVLCLFTLNLYAEKNWIEIEPLDKAQKTKETSKVSLKSEPVNQMVQNIRVITKLLDSTSKKEDVKNNEKNWFVLNSKETP